MVEKWERWNKEELATLKEHYPDMPRKRLMRLLPGRTWKAIMGAAERYVVRRNRDDVPKTKKQKAALHAKMCTARQNRTDAPFGGKHHTADAKLHISVSNLHTRGHSIADIAMRVGIAKKEVKKILDNRKRLSDAHD